MDKPRMTFSGWRGPGDRKKIVVPEGMMKAALDAVDKWEPGPQVQEILEGALRWQSENPPVPTEEQMKKMIEHVGQYPRMFRQFVTEWVSRMYDAPPEPEVPEAIKDKLWEPLVGTPLNPSITLGIAKDHDEDLIEAYRRGQYSIQQAEK